MIKTPMDEIITLFRKFLTDVDRLSRLQPKSDHKPGFFWDEEAEKYRYRWEIEEEDG